MVYVFVILGVGEILYIGWRWRHFNDFAKAILEVVTVLQELNVITQRLITLLLCHGTAAVKLAHKS